MEELIKNLQEVAAQDCPSDWLSEGDDLNVDDFAGNVNDAFRLGRTEGQVLLARALLDVIAAQSLGEY